MKDIYVSETANKQPETKSELKNETQEEAEARVKVEVKDIINTILRRSGERKRSELWGSFSILPDKRFVNEQDDEEVVMLLRAHPITNLGWIISVIFLLAIPVVVEMAGVLNQFPWQYVWVGKIAWYLVTLGFSFEKFLVWFYSVLIITNERIVDFDFVNLMYREVQSVNLNHIEQPSMTSGGFVRSLFRFGDIRVATAADVAAPTIEGHAIPHPEKVIRIISELSEELEKRRERGE